MKKLSLLLILAIGGLSACQKEVVQPSTSPQAYSAVYSINSSDWSTSDNGISYSTTFNIPELSNAIFDHGAVLVYLSFDNNIYEALPEVFGGISYGAIHSPGAVTVDYHAVDGSAVSAPGGVVYAKIILINALQLSMHPGVNLKDYN
ncbi:MAG: hypothetical protein ACRDE2_13370, partial [Chitinophagaceae bacterium]